MGFDFGGLMSGIGGFADTIIGSDNARKQMHMQKEFAQNGIQWKVEDAKKAGIHPLYALGANTMSYSPQTVGTDLAGVGQNLGRAIDSTRTEPQKIDAVGQTLAQLQIERGGLENQLLRQQIAASAIATTRGAAAAPSSPAFPVAGNYVIPGQGNSGVVVDQPLKRVGNPEAPYQEPGSVSDRGFLTTSSGGLAPVYSTDAQQRLDDDSLGMLSWNIRNRLLDPLNGGKPPYTAPRGSVWVYDYLRNQYHLQEVNMDPRNTKFYK